MQFYQLRPSSTKDDKRAKRPRPSHFESSAAEITPLMDAPESDLATHPDRIILGSSWPRANSFVYWLLPDPAAAWRHVRNAYYRQFFVCVEPARRVRCYMDMEATARRDMPPARFLAVARRLVAYFCCYLDSVYLMNTGCLYDGHWHFYDASTRNKLSLHAHSSLTFLDTEELRVHMHRFVELLRHLHVHAHDPAVADFFFDDHKQRDRCILDTSVYTKRRLFRLPFNAKSVDKRNWFRPVVDTAAARLLTREQHFYMGFVHPMPALHQMYIPVPRDPAPINQRVVTHLLHTTHWPLPSLEALSDALACAADMLAEYYQAPPAPAHLREQCVDDDAVRAAAFELLLGPSTSADRQHWLLAVAAILQIMAVNSRPREATLFEQLPGALAAAHSMALGSDLLCERLRMICRNANYVLPDDLLQLEPTPSTRRGDPYTEFAFCVFHARLQEYAARNQYPHTDPEALAALVGSDPVDSFTGEPFPIDGAAAIVAQYEQFQQVPASLLCAPAQLLTLDRLPKIWARDPLAADDTAPRPAAAARLGPDDW